MPDYPDVLYPDISLVMYEPLTMMHLVMWLPHPMKYKAWTPEWCLLWWACPRSWVPQPFGYNKAPGVRVRVGYKRYKRSRWRNCQEAVNEHLTALGKELTSSPLVGYTSTRKMDQFQQQMSMESPPTHCLVHCRRDRNWEGAKNHYVVCRSPLYIVNLFYWMRIWCSSNARLTGWKEHGESV